MYRQQHTSFKASGLRGRRCFERFPMPAEPYVNDAVAAYPLVDAAGNRLHFRQFRHLFIVGEWLCRDCSLRRDRKSTRLNSSHANISYAVSCLKNIGGLTETVVTDLVISDLRVQTSVDRLI